MYLKLIIKYEDLKKRYKKLEREYFDLLALVDEDFWNGKDIYS